MIEDHFIEKGSFKDPNGQIYEQNNNVFRKIYPSYFETYKLLKKNGFIERLIKKELLIFHEEISHNEKSIVLKHSKIPFISYPYEWSFNQIKEAALLTLEIQHEAINNGFSLKDASAYNVQFLGTRPIFIDTTSFEIYEEGQPWKAYKQFCEHFIVPLLLMKYRDIHFSKWLIYFLDGIPLMIAKKILPFRSNFNLLTLIHVVLHSKAIKNANKKYFIPTQAIFISKKKMLNIIEHLYESIECLSICRNSKWNKYYLDCPYDSTSRNEKTNFVLQSISNIGNYRVLDIGSNECYFIKNFFNKFNYYVAIDNDPYVINNLFQNIKPITNVLPLVLDITNPSPSVGWANFERKSFLTRINTNNVSLALAIIHHLRITYNIPLTYIAQLFALLSKQLIIEFVPKNDIQVKKLLYNKKDIYNDYNENEFLSIFSKYFNIVDSKKLTNSERIIYNMIRNEKNSNINPNT
ncbi:MAG: hypothetical protein N3A01_06700 [Bacteroidales bacterium]|nr:hypothetical protein [Bacteroidales bacterium]